MHESPSDPIRLLFLIPSFNAGGAETQLLSLVRGLDRTKFQITVAAFYRGGELDADFERTPDVKVVFLQKKNGLDLTFFKKLLAVLEERKIHIVQCYNVSARFFGILASRLNGKVRVIATERTARPIYSSTGSRSYLFLEKYAMRSADLVIANSRAGQQFAVSRGIAEDKTRVIYNGIDPERVTVKKAACQVRQELELPESAFVVGMVARLEPIKDPMTFIKAALRLIQHIDDIYFVLVGDGPLGQQMQTRIGELQLTDRFRMPGYRRDTADLMNAMDVVTLTSSQVEGCSNTLIEAMWLRKPVVATHVGGNVELISHGDNGLLIKPQDAGQLADTLEHLYHNRVIRKELAAHAQKDARERFSQTEMVARYEAEFQRLASGPGGQKVLAIRKSGKPFARSHILGCPIDRITLDDCIAYFNDVIESDGRCHIVVVNAAKVVKARKDDELSQVIQNAQLVGADGVSIVWASRLLGQPLPGRVNGTDLMHRLFETSAEKGWRLYLLGARDRVIRDVVENLRRQMPTINIVGYRHGYFDSLEDEIRVVDEINAASPDILMLGFGSPMKEKWVNRHKQRLQVPVIHGVGGSFDIVGGVTRRAPKWMQNSGLEWFYRLLQEPGRMWRRYLVTNTVFVWLVIRAWLRHMTDSLEK